MEIRIPVRSQLELFKRWLSFLNPILQLREETEIPVLASFILLAYNYRDYDPSVLNSLLFSDDTKRSIRDRLGVSERSFNKSVAALVEKGLIIPGKVEDGIIHPDRLRDSVIPKDFVLNIKFDYEGERAEVNNGL
jgi:hypothetical protein